MQSDNSLKHKFQVHLSGIIDLLSNHLYSGPQVFVRELLQNAVDAITARLVEHPDHEGKITLEIIDSEIGAPPTLVVIDNGIGLTEDEIHRFLATIGNTGKQKELFEQPVDFIGQFGVGLLACFVVSQEIVVITRSARPDSKTIEWRGSNDGTYSVRVLENQSAPGTQVYLTAKDGCHDYFKANRVQELATHFGSLLPYSINVVFKEKTWTVNEKGLPWTRQFDNEEKQIQCLKNFGRNAFGINFLDAVKLHSSVGQVDGVAFVLPYAPALTAKSTHKVYLKNMLLSEHAEGLLPEWAFFVKCIVNANQLRPTASRESFYEDDALERARDELGECLRTYLIDLARNHPTMLSKFLSLHYLSIKALSVQDDELYKLFINLLPFETSMGVMNLQECRKHSSTIRYVDRVDSFRQMSMIAAAQGMCLVNAGYTYDCELLQKLPDFYPDDQVESIEAGQLVQDLEDLDLNERELVFDLVGFADRVLQPFKCRCEVKKFLPSDVAALFVSSQQGDLMRSIEQSQASANPLWSSLLDGLKPLATTDSAYNQLCLNFNNPLVLKLCAVKERDLLERVIHMLYVQTLLLGHHPLNPKEHALLSHGMIDLIEYCLKSQTSK